MIREKDFRGAQVWIGDVVLMRSRIVWMLSGRKTSFEVRFVMMRVFEGGVGRESGGRLERSRDIGDARRDDLRVGGEDEAGELSVDIVRYVETCLFSSL